MREPSIAAALASGLAFALALALVDAASAHADGTTIGVGSPRAIGRAGADEIGDDGGGALLVDPAAMARRDVARVQLGAGWVDDALSWRPYDASQPKAAGQAGSRALPMIAAQLPLGDGWVVGVAAMTAAISARALSAPQVPAADFGAQYGYRYAGLSGLVRRDTLTAGVSHRLGDEIAVGIAASASRVHVAETRDVWAGFSGIHAPGDPRDDVAIGVDGVDDFAPGLVGGLMLVPNDTALELAVSASWQQAAQLRGGVTAAGPLGADGGPTARANGATAALDLASPWTIRAGARYAGSRWTAELDGDLWVFPSHARDEAWTIQGVSVSSGATTAALTSLPSRLAPVTHGAVRGAVDVALLPGFLWVTAGYAYGNPGTPEGRLSPTLADLGGHTAALGVEANAGRVTVTLGVSRTWATARHPGSTAFSLDNPFQAGDAPVALGSYDGTVDLAGLQLDAEFGGK